MPTNLHTSYVEEITNPQAYTKFLKKASYPWKSKYTHTHKKVLSDIQNFSQIFL